VLKSLRNLKYASVDVAFHDGDGHSGRLLGTDRTGVLVSGRHDEAVFFPWSSVLFLAPSLDSDRETVPDKEEDEGARVAPFPFLVGDYVKFNEAEWFGKVTKVPSPEEWAKSSVGDRPQFRIHRFGNHYDLPFYYPEEFTRIGVDHPAVAARIAKDTHYRAEDLNREAERRRVAEEALTIERALRRGVESSVPLVLPSTEGGTKENADDDTDEA
jgi:hypothetical protein